MTDSDESFTAGARPVKEPKNPAPARRRGSAKSKSIIFHETDNLPHEEPIQTFSTFTDLDVMMGRGNGIAQLPGNLRFRRIVHPFRDFYMSAKNAYDKKQCVIQAYKAVRADGARFLEVKKWEHPTKSRDGVFRSVTLDRMLEKCAQALRERKWTPPAPEHETKIIIPKIKPKLSPSKKQTDVVPDAAVSSSTTASPTNDPPKPTRSQPRRRSSLSTSRTIQEPPQPRRRSSLSTTRIIQEPPQPRRRSSLSTARTTPESQRQPRRDSVSTRQERQKQRELVMSSQEEEMPPFKEKKIVESTDEETASLSQASDDGSDPSPSPQVAASSVIVANSDLTNEDQPSPQSSVPILVPVQAVVVDKTAAVPKKKKAQKRKSATKKTVASSIKKAIEHERATDASSAKVVYDLTEDDVLFGRGSNTNKHPGNVRFREMCLPYRELYSTLDASEKRPLAQQVLDQCKGRFLEPDPTDNTAYRFVSLTRCLEKVCQALREKSWQNTAVTSRQSSTSFAEVAAKVAQAQRSLEEAAATKKRAAPAREEVKRSAKKPRNTTKPLRESNTYAKQFNTYAHSAHRLVKKGSRISVYWEADNTFYECVVDDIKDGDLFHVRYFIDGETEWVNLSEHRYTFLEEKSSAQPPPAPGTKAAAPGEAAAAQNQFVPMMKSGQTTKRGGRRTLFWGINKPDGGDQATPEPPAALLF